MPIESLRDITRGGGSAFAAGGFYEGATAPDPVNFPLWFNTTDGVFLVRVGTVWVEPGANFVPTGGTTGQVLLKVSGTDFDLAWGAPTIDWAAVTGKPTTFTPSAHSHAIADVTGLQDALDGKQAAGSYLTAETDPVFQASAAAGITGTNISNWNTAFGWGNHASAGYQVALVSGTNIKTINGESVLGSGNIVVSGGGSSLSPILSWAI